MSSAVPEPHTFVAEQLQYAPLYTIDVETTDPNVYPPGTSLHTFVDYVVNDLRFVRADYLYSDGEIRQIRIPITRATNPRLRELVMKMVRDTREYQQNGGNRRIELEPMTETMHGSDVFTEAMYKSLLRLTVERYIPLRERRPAPLTTVESPRPPVFDRPAALSDIMDIERFLNPPPVAEPERGEWTYDDVEGWRLVEDSPQPPSLQPDTQMSASSPSPPSEEPFTPPLDSEDSEFDPDAMEESAPPPEELLARRPKRPLQRRKRKGRCFPLRLAKEGILSGALRMAMGDAVRQCQLPEYFGDGNMDTDYLSDCCAVSALREAIRLAGLEERLGEDFERFSAMINYNHDVSFDLLRHFLLSNESTYHAFYGVHIYVHMYEIAGSSDIKTRTVRLTGPFYPGHIRMNEQAHGHGSAELHLEFMRFIVKGDGYEDVVAHYIPRIEPPPLLVALMKHHHLCSPHEARHMGSILLRLFLKGLLKPMDWSESEAFNSSLRLALPLQKIPVTDVTPFFENPLSLPPSRTTEKKEQKPRKEKASMLRIFCDFETIVHGEHEPFCLSMTAVPLAAVQAINAKLDNEGGALVEAVDTMRLDGRLNVWTVVFSSNGQAGRTGKYFEGKIAEHLISLCDDQEKLTNTRPKEIVLYFHNLRYDYNFLLRFTSLISQTICKGSTGMISMRCRFALPDNRGHVDVTVKDTLGILQCKLEDIPRMYWSGDARASLQQRYGKVPFPYRYLYKRAAMIYIEDAITEIHKRDPSQVERFKTLAQRFTFGPVHEGESLLNLHRYCKFYCEMDTILLALGWLKAKEMYATSLHLDVDRALTVPGLMYTLAKQTFFRDPSITPFGATLRLYEQRSVRGGRCMPAFNQSWHVTVPIVDFDAVSLYPSAMVRLYCFKGRPEPLSNFAWFTTGMPIADLLPRLCGEDEHSIPGMLTGGTFTITVSRVNKGLAFPLLCYKNSKKGCNWTNQPSPADYLVVNEIELQNLVEFQGIEGNVVTGYAWTGEKDFACRSTFHELHELRKQFKAEGNPLQTVIKLLSNSGYGKSVLRPINEEVHFIRNELLESYVANNRQRVNEVYDIAHSPFVGIKQLREPTSPEFFFNWWGARVLSMSKRIMSEVMVLAQDIGTRIYYTDTDSMLVEQRGIPALEAAFREKYGRELIGTELGMFHNDFFDEPRAFARETVIVDRKIYYCMVQMPDGSLREHYRMKGIPQQGIIARADLDTPHRSIAALYFKLFNDEAVEFPVGTRDRPSFLFKRNGTVSSCDTMKRKIQRNPSLLKSEVTE